jgi:CTP synthase
MIISNPDLSTVYEIPLILSKQDLERKILKKLGLLPKKASLDQWMKLIDLIKKPKEKMVEVTIVGKYFGTGDYQLRDSYAALFDALDHASWHLGINLKTTWIDAQKVEKQGVKIIGKPDGIIVPIGWGERGAEGMIQAASYARQEKIPYLGLCYGMQLAVVAFARDVLGWKDANTTENDKTTKHPVITLMPSQEKYMKERAYGGTMRLGAWEAYIKANTLAFLIYKKNRIFERHRHRYEFNDKYSHDFEKAGLIISGRSVKENLAEFIELPKSIHPFYFATQGHPEYKSRPLKPHPVFLLFLKAAAEFKK